MDLILWRHCDAEPGEPDLARKLTAHGARDARHMARWLGERLPEDCRILVSPAVRTQQTAAALGRDFETCDAIAPGARVEAVLAVVRWPAAPNPVLVVGHQPTLGETAAFLLGNLEMEWSMKKGAVWWLVKPPRERRHAVVLKLAVAPGDV
ncbi:MAG TPA: histidine phosphatase family protein [Casimicrobiaceae bacterium]